MVQFQDEVFCFRTKMGQWDHENCHGVYGAGDLSVCDSHEADDEWVWDGEREREREQG